MSQLLTSQSKQKKLTPHPVHLKREGASAQYLQGSLFLTTERCNHTTYRKEINIWWQILILS